MISWLAMMEWRFRPVKLWKVKSLRICLAFLAARNNLASCFRDSFEDAFQTIALCDGLVTLSSEFCDDLLLLSNQEFDLHQLSL